jgi:hypothetical protein
MKLGLDLNHTLAKVQRNGHNTFEFAITFMV